MRINKLSILICIFIIAGCAFTIDQPPPNADTKWLRLNTTQEQVREDMLLCGFENVYDNQDMPMGLYIKASLCMEKKYYDNRIFERYGNKTCDRYAEYKACGGSRID